jgi:SMC interacting uncharacterized protein involved in chromosome segregation
MTGKLLIMVILAASLAACATSSDPRQGGLFGYLAHHDEYDERLQQRNQELTRQRSINTQLSDESQALDNQVKERGSVLAAERQRLAGMEDELSLLERDVNLLKAKSAKQKSDIDSLKQKILVQRKQLKSQESALNELERSGGKTTNPEKYRALVQERDRLAKEYKQLLAYSQALTNAAK